MTYNFNNIEDMKNPSSCLEQEQMETNMLRFELECLMKIRESEEIHGETPQSVQARFLLFAENTTGILN